MHFIFSASSVWRENKSQVCKFRGGTHWQSAFYGQKIDGRQCIWTVRYTAEWKYRVQHMLFRRVYSAGKLAAGSLQNLLLCSISPGEHKELFCTCSSLIQLQKMMDPSKSFHMKKPSFQFISPEVFFPASLAISSYKSLLYCIFPVLIDEMLFGSFYFLQFNY